MSRRAWGAVLLLGSIAAGVTGCVEPRKESPRDRITRLRMLHRVEGREYEVKKERDGTSVLVLKVDVTNGGHESLNEVTMLLHLRAPDGKDRLVMPVTMDVSRIRPGTLNVHPPQPGRAAVSELKPGPTGRLVVGVPGVEVRPGEEIFLEMQAQPSKVEMEKYPEYRGVS